MNDLSVLQFALKPFLEEAWESSKETAKPKSDLSEEVQLEKIDHGT